MLLHQKQPKIVQSSTGRAYWEAFQYHDPRRWGYFSVLSGQYKKKQKSYPLHQLAKVLENLHGVPGNHWISQAEFTQRNRRAINLHSIGLLFLDLDYYKISKYEKKSANEMSDIFLNYCEKIGFPEPSIVINSGQGLQIKWFHEALPATAFPIWAAAESWLVWAFVDLGADVGVTDVSRVLRILDTINQKTGRLVTPTHINWNMGSDMHHYAFKEDLCTAILPYSQEEYYERKKQQESVFLERREKAKLELLEAEEIQRKKGNASNLRKFNPVRLSWGQVEDYMRLGRERLPEMRPEGWTNELMWLAASALAIAVWGDVDRFYYELSSLGRQIAPHWKMSRVHESCSSVYSRCKQMSRGEWVEFKNKKYPPVYTPRHSTIISKLGLTDAEIRKNKIIIPTSLKKERDANLKRKIRHKDGENKVTRKEYQSDAKEKREKVIELFNQGMSKSEIARTLGISRRVVQHYVL